MSDASPTIQSMRQFQLVETIENDPNDFGVAQFVHWRLNTGDKISEIWFSSAGSKGSSCHSTLRCTDSRLAVLNSVVGISGRWLENWSASLLMLVPCTRQKSAALLNTARSSRVDVCQSAGPRSVSGLLAKGEPLITPTFFRAREEEARAIACHSGSSDCV
jgi:hypothetical protein